MTKIYIVRHCEALGNIKRIFQGHTDLDISDLGALQLKNLEKRFDKIQLDKVISSPLLRARKTALAIIGSKNLELETDEGLIELNGGIAEGNTFDATFEKYPEYGEIWKNHPYDWAPEKGEKMTDAYERIWETITSIATENRDKTIACASHGGVLRCLNCRLLNNNIKELANTPWTENTGITLIEFDNDLSYSLKFFNDTSHLTPELLNKKSSLSNSTAGDKR